MRYLDASVVLAYYLPDPLSDAAATIYRAGGGLVLSDWAELEATSVIARLTRSGSLAERDARTTLALLRDHVDAALYRRVTTGAEHVEEARRLIADLRVPLRAPDGLHVVLARAHRLTLVTGDRQLARSGAALDVPVEVVEA